MSKLYDLYFNRWYKKRKKLAAKDPVWTAIEARRKTDHGAVIFLSDDLSLEDWETQKAIENRLMPYTWVHSVHHWLENHGVRATYFDFLAFWQRGRRGWADRDLTGLDMYLAKVLSGSIDQLRRTRHGYPDDVTPEEWDAILAEITEAFTHWNEDKFWSGDDAKFQYAARQVEIERACRLLGKWFGALWN